MNTFDEFRRAEMHEEIEHTLAVLQGKRDLPNKYAKAKDITPTPTQPVQSFDDIENLIPIDDMPDEDADIFPDEYEHEFKLIPLPQTGNVPFQLWQSIAYDLALEEAPISEICNAYGVSYTALNELINNNAYFKKLLSSTKQEVLDVGDNASSIMKFRMIASMAIPEFTRRVTSKSTSDREFHAMFKTALEMARYTPQPPTQGRNGDIVIEGGSSGTEVVFNLFDMPGLDHLKVKDVTPQRTIIDASEIDEL